MALLRLENGGVEALVLLDVGGRIVAYNKVGSPNMLESDSSLWNEKKEERLVPSPSMLEFKAYNGHEVWLGPQSRWWKQQVLNQEKIASDLFWPPDPYISFGEYVIEEQSANSVVIVGNPSPISGVRLKKNIRVESDGSLFFEVEAMNIRQSRVAWDLWLLTRVNGHNENYVPVSNPNDVWLGDPSHPWQGRPTYKVENGFASFTPLENPREYEECTGKLYIKTDTPVIYTKCGTEWLKIEYEHHNPSSVHPEHTEIEMYNFVHEEKRKSLLELEYHAPYKILNPNETMATWCRWSILPQMDKRF